MATYILAIDQGTTGTTSLVVKFHLAPKNRWRLYHVVIANFPNIFPKPGWVEHDLNEIWGSVEVSIAEALQKAELKGEDIKAIGITNQRETTGIWDQDGKPIHNAIVWQDRRTADFCTSLREKNLSELFSQKTGLVLDPYFSGTKVRWLLENVEVQEHAPKQESCALGRSTRGWSGTLPRVMFISQMSPTRREH